MSKIIYIMLFSILCNAAVYSQLHLNMDTAVRLSLQNNISLKAESMNSALAEQDIISAGLRENPSLTVNPQIFPAPGEKFNPSDKSYDLDINVPIDIGSKREKRITVAKLNHEATAIQYEDSKRKLSSQVKQLFLTAIALHEKLKLVDSNLVRLKEFSTIVNLRAKNKEVAEIDAIRASLISDQYATDVRKIQSDYFVAVMDLIHISGVNASPDSLILDGDIGDVLAPDTSLFSSALETAFSHRSDYLSLRKQLESAKANEKLQESLASIDLSLTGSFVRQQETTFYGLGATFALPIFNRNQGERAKSKIQSDQNQMQLSALEWQLQNEIKKSQRDLLITWNVLERQKNELLPKAEQILKIVGFSYQKGNTNFLDYLDAERSYSELKISYVESLLDYQLTYFNYLTTLGKE